MWGRYVFDLRDDCCSSDKRGRWDWEGFTGGWWGGGPKGRHWRGRGGKIFEQGDLKYVILRLLEEKPRHGYEIIKELESRVGGAYAPSPGTVYPTLSMLEDLGYARVTSDESGKKVYEITDEGRAHLAEHSTTVNDIFDRIAKFVEGITDEPMVEVNTAFRRVARAAYGTATSNLRDKDKLAAISKILRNAADELEALTK